MREETFVCSICGHEHPINDMTYFDGQDLCPDCLESRTCTCDRCGERIWRDDDHGEDSLTLCAHCAEAYYDHCSDCGAFAEVDLLHFQNNGDRLCDDCYHHRRQQECGVQSYCYVSQGDPTLLRQRRLIP